jgi:hypothetical protein
MVVMWTTAKPATKSRVVYGQIEDALRESADAKGVPLEDGVSFMHTATLGPLIARKTYFYKCGNDEDGWSEVFRFMREGESMPDIETVTFVTYGDMGVHFANSEVTLNALKKERLSSLNFVFHAGDMAYAFKNMTRWSLFMSRIEQVAANVPYLVCLGNRDDVADVEKRWFVCFLVCFVLFLYCLFIFFVC